MRSILEELWYGNVCPSSGCREGTKEVKELMGYPPIDIKFTDRLAYYNAFDEYHVKGKLSTMENLFAGYIEAKLDRYLKILEG